MAEVEELNVARHVMLAMRGFYACRESGDLGNSFVVVAVHPRTDFPRGFGVGTVITHVGGEAVASCEDDVVVYLLTNSRVRFIGDDVVTEFPHMFFADAYEGERNIDMEVDRRSMTNQEATLWAGRVEAFFPRPQPALEDTRQAELQVLHRNRQRRYVARQRLPPHRSAELVEDQRDDEFYTNFSRETADCNAYYSHPKFVASSRENNVQNALQSERYFGFRKTSGYQSLELFWNQSCSHCGARYLNVQTAAFRSRCCRYAQTPGFPSFEPLSHGVREVLMTAPVHMSANAITYNNMLAFGATCVSNDTGGGFQHNFRGCDHAVTIRGRTYHLLHEQDSSNPSGLGFMFFDNMSAPVDAARSRNNSRSNASEMISEERLTQLVNDVRVNNVIAQEVDSIGVQYREAPPANYRDLTQLINNSTTYLDVGCVRADSTSGNGVRVVSFTPKNSNGASRMLNPKSSMLEPFSYPLLFTRGEKGWGKDCSKDVTLSEYISTRILQSEGILLPSLLGGTSFRHGVNRLQAMSRLGQVFVVDQMSRMIDMRLDFVRRNQMLIRGGINNDTGGADEGEDLSEAENADVAVRKKTVFCPASVTGGRRHLAGLAKNALAVVAECNHPTEFTTLTFGAKWREMLEMLLEGQTAFERQDIAVQVFHEKLRVFLANLRAGKYHLGKFSVRQLWDAHTNDWSTVDEKYVPHNPGTEPFLDYLMVVIEYQHRGLPHAHIVYRIRAAPECPKRGDSLVEEQAKYDKMREYIDGGVVSVDVSEDGQERTVETTFPHVWAHRVGKSTTPLGSRTPDEDARTFADDLVAENNLHKCAFAENGCKRTEDAPCKRFFDIFTVCQHTSFNDKGRPVYRRPTQADLNVVGYNLFMMLDWKAHLNVEFTANPHSILYLYSYLFKGGKKVTGQATSDDPTISNDGIVDEVDIYVKGRLLCAHDATGRALGYPTYPATEPACKVVAVKTEAQVNFFLAEKRATDMYLYMASRNVAAVCNLSFVDFFRQYYGTYTAPTQARRARGDYFEIPSPDPSKRLYVFKYHVQPNHIVRVEMLFPSVGDAWYLRLILRMRPVVDWEDARSYPPKGQLGSTVYASHQEAAQRAGYLVGELFDEAMLCFAEAMVDSTPHVLRGLFCVLTLDGFVTGNILRDEQCVERLTDDYTTQRGKSPGEAFILLLQDLKRRLAQQQKTLEDFGLHVDPVTNLPYVLEGRSELDEEKARYDPGQQGRVFSALEHRYPSNVEQQHAVDTILQAVETARTRGEQQFVCLHGAAGTGKSIVAQKVAAKLRSMGHIVTICASTTLAATNFAGADTAHSTFAYPVVEDDEDEEVECHLDTQAYAERKELLLATSVILWDEVFGNHAQLIEAAVKAVAENTALVWVFIGDTRQILPVVENGNDYDIIGACLTSTSLWRKVNTLFLTENKRLTDLRASLVDEATPEDQRLAEGQLRYAAAILEIGESRTQHGDTVFTTLRTKKGPRTTSFVAMPGMKYFTTAQTDEALAWVHPDLDLSDEIHVCNTAILAFTNEKVDAWNAKIQEMNPNVLQRLLSHDYFSEVDDPHGFLA